MAALGDDTRRRLAVRPWEAIKLPNLIEHIEHIEPIEPTRARATWVVGGLDRAALEITGEER